ncbi:MAG: hypothetical protein ACFFDB_00310 [Promethearchaeota archaeon]
MSQRSPVYYGSIEENLYNILMERGKEILNDFIISKLKLKKFKAVRDLGVLYIPEEMKKNLIFPNPELKIERSINDFIRDYKDEIVNSLDVDWVEISTSLKDQFGAIHIDFQTYFLKKFDYLRRSSLFQYNLKVVKDLVDLLYRSSPPGWKKGWNDQVAEDRLKSREQREEDRKAGISKPSVEIKYYSLNNNNVLEQGYIPIKFKLLFDVLKNYKAYTIAFTEISRLENEIFYKNLDYLQSSLNKITDPKDKKEHEKKIEDAKSIIEKYKTQKYRITVENHRKTMAGILAKIENLAIRTNKKFLKMLYEYHQNSIRGYVEKRSPFST